MASAPVRRNPRTVRAASWHGSPPPFVASPGRCGRWRSRRGSGLEVRSEGIARAGRGLALLRFSGAEALGARAMTRVAATRDWDAGGDSCEFASGIDGGMTA